MNKGDFRLSALLSMPQDMGSSHDSDQKPVEDGAIERPAVEAVAELAEVHLHMLGAGSVIGAVDERFCIANDPVQPLEHLTVRIEHLILVGVSFRQRLTIAFICVRLNGVAGGDVLREKTAYRLLFDIISGVHFQVCRASLLILGNRNKYTLISGSTASFTLLFCTKIGVIEFYDATKHIVCIPFLHRFTDTAKHIPGGFIADFDLASKSQGGDSALVTSHKINCPEPFFQGQMAVVKHGFRGKGGLVTALGALITTIPADCITVPTSTLGADIAVRPLELIQVLLAGFFSGKSLDKLAETQSFLFRHFWHLPFDASIHLLMSDSLDTITISSVVLTKADNLNYNLHAC